MNTQGTGTTIVEISPSHHMRVFASITHTGLPGACPGGIGLTTALAILPGDFVMVGSLPTKGGDPATAKAGCLLVLNADGRVVETFHGHGINGPWDMTAVSFGRTAFVFVTNVLNGTVAAKGRLVHEGTVIRLVLVTPPNGKPPVLVSRMTIGSGFAERTDPAALVIGPTGVGLGHSGALYVADTLGNRIAAIPGAPNGDILTVNSLNGNLVETTPGGAQVTVGPGDETPHRSSSGPTGSKAVEPDPFRNP